MFTLLWRITENQTSSEIMIGPSYPTTVLLEYGLFSHQKISSIWSLQWIGLSKNHVFTEGIFLPSLIAPITCLYNRLQ